MVRAVAVGTRVVSSVAATEEAPEVAGRTREAVGARCGIGQSAVDGVAELEQLRRYRPTEAVAVDHKVLRELGEPAELRGQRTRDEIEAS
eukprot:510555-Prymnesium_polylepis.2